MASKAIDTQGSILRRGDGGGPETFTKIAEVVSFDGPGGEASEIDVTSLDSTAKEFRLGLQDEGTFTFGLILDTTDAEQEGLRDDRENRVVRNFELELQDTETTVLSFAALVKGFTISGAVDDVVKASVTLRITGPVAWSSQT